MSVFSITNLEDERLDPFRQIRSSNVTRQSGVFIAEGRYVVERLLESRFQTRSVLVTEARFHKLRDRLIQRDHSILVVPRHLIEPLVGFDFHAGIMACGVREPASEVSTVIPDDTKQLTLVACPHTTDPVNLGNIIRLCCAFGADAILLGRGCADPFSRRVLRVSMGSVFRIPVIESVDLMSVLANERTRAGLAIAAMVTDEGAIPLDQVRVPKRLVIVFGNEGRGLEHSWKTFADHLWTIPMSGDTDSINVANSAAIAMFQIQTGRM